MKELIREAKLENKIILLVEDNPNDVTLTQRALKKANIMNKMIVARDDVSLAEITRVLGGRTHLLAARRVEHRHRHQSQHREAERR